MMMCGLIGATMALVSCGASQKTESEACSKDTTVYVGLLPAADCDGIAFRVALAGDSLKGCHVTSTYKGTWDGDVTFTQTGHYEEMVTDSNRYYRLTCDNDEAYFLILDDSTLRMVNSFLEEPVVTEGMSYDLKME